MASIIRIKRSTTAGDPSTLGAGELAYSSLAGTQANGGDRLYVGVGTETAGNAAAHIVIGGKYFTDLLDHAHGTLTASSAIVVDADSKINVLNVDNLTLDGNTISSTDSNGNILLDPAGTGYVQLVGTNGVVIPVGTTLQRGPSVQGTVRYNTDTSSFEGYSGTTWGSLGGVKSVDGLTYIIPESSPGASDDTLTFVTDGTTAMELDNDTLDIASKIGTVNINATTGSSSTTTGALVVDGGVGIAGNVNVGGTLTVSGAVEYTGGATFNSNLTLIGSDTDNQEFFRVKNASGVDKFVVDSASGNTTIVGTLDVTGESTLASATISDLTATRVTFAGTNGSLVDNANLTFTSGTTLTAHTLAATNNATVGGTLGVTGITTLTGLVNANGGIAVSTNKFTVASATGNTVVAGTLDVDGAVNLNSTLTVDGATTIGASGGRVATNVYASALSLTATDNSEIGVTAGAAGTKTLTLTASNSVGDANLDINVDDTATLDATVISLDATDSSNFSMTANSSATKTLSIDASNAGTGAGNIAIGSANTDNTTVTSATKTTLTGTAELELNSDTLIDVNSAGTITIDSTGTTTLTASGATINADTLVIRGTEGAADTSIVTIAGQLNIDNIRMDGNTISTTDGSNTIYIDPAPSGSAGLVVIEGNLQVNGTQTTINSTTVTIDDPIFVLGGDEAPSADDNLDRGIEFQWHNGTAAKIGFFGYDDSASEFVFVPDATDTASVISGTLGNAAFGKLRLADTTASTTTTSGAFTLAGGAGISGQLNVGGATNKFTASTASSSTTTGAVVVTGGVGIGGSVYVGTNIVGAGAATSTLDGFNIDGGTY
jgi:hypothetical protein